MTNLNRVTLIGNLTRDPELRVTKTGVPVARIGIATNRVWKDAASGERKQDVDYHDVVAWRGVGETAAKYLKKGDRLFVEGRLRVATYKGKDGVDRRKPEVIMDQMIMLSGGRKGVGAAKNMEVKLQKSGDVPEEVSVEEIGF